MQAHYTVISTEGDRRHTSTAQPLTTSPPDPAEDEPRSAEDVATVINGVPSIGMAANALEAAGYAARILGNRITVDGEVVAQFVGGCEPSWIVFRLGGTPPVWVVGAGTVA